VELAPEAAGDPVAASSTVRRHRRRTRYRGPCALIFTTPVVPDALVAGLAAMTCSPHWGSA
jgi:hypothetical protein